MYIFPLNDEENREDVECEEDVENLSPFESYDDKRNGCVELASEENAENSIIGDEDGLEGAKKPRRFNIHRVNQLLQQLEGKLLSYKMFARDTKASRNV